MRSSCVANFMKYWNLCLHVIVKTQAYGMQYIK